MDGSPAPQLIATSWTSAGDVRPGRTGGVSPVDVDERIAAVAAAGYAGLGLGLDDLLHLERTIGLDGLRDRIAAAGLRHVEVEFLDDWWLEGARREASDAARAGLLRAAEALGARHVKVGCGAFGDSRDHARLVDELRLLADQAADHGTRIALEPGAGSALDLAGEAIPLVTELAHPALGLMLDPWHLVRAGLPYAQVLSDLPEGLVVAAELSDGAAICEGTLFDDTFDRRLPPGEGDFDVAAFVAAVRGAGFDGPWGVEVMSERTRQQAPAEVLATCARTARDCLTA
ncbi:sugar phosphate isomerase/epimerase family protein [Amnibacterium endophyticum]|uniref:Sugar phosphate isomerase/epimerase family protein n=1 Tax=Amnibacterium endophyticum TaxID=2109337 RepID=A0ABW4LAZ4_9MICO